MPTPKQSITLKLHGKPFDPKPPSPGIHKVINFLDTAPKDEIFLHNDVCARVGLGESYLLGRTSIPELVKYTAAVSGRRYFGHPLAIIELKRQMGEL